jgi:hypothetical protein
MIEKLRQGRSSICVYRIEIAHTRLKTVAGADNLYSLIAIIWERTLLRSRLVGLSTSRDVLLWR